MAQFGKKCMRRPRYLAQHHVKFEFDESSMMSVASLKQQGLRFEEISITHVNKDRTLIVPVASSCQSK